MRGFGSRSALIGILLIVSVVLIWVVLFRLGETSSASIEFEGPWALVPDPQDAAAILAIAPKTKTHQPLTLGDVPGVVLQTGVYTLVVPGHGPSSPPKLDQTFFRVQVAAQNVTQALGARSQRYAIRLPRPERYVPQHRAPSLIGNEPERNYVTSVSLLYKVKRFAGMSLAGTSDAGGSFQTLRLQTANVQFRIAPIPDPNDVCDAHTREAFHELAKLLGLAPTLSLATPEHCQMKMP